MKRDLQNPELNSLLPDVQVDRRGFVAACLAAGFAVTAEPLLAQAIRTPLDGLEGSDIKIGEIPAYYAVPKSGGKHAVVLVVAEVFGLHEHIKDVVRRVAKEGYSATPKEPYFRQGELWKLEDLKQVIAGANQLSDEQAFKDLDATLAWPGRHARGNVENLGITGFCRGGRTVWMYDAHQSKIHAGVAWYGSLGPAEPAIKTTPLDAVEKLHGPVLGLYGGADQGIPQDQVDKLVDTLKKSKNKSAKASDIHVYPGTPHGFNADYRPSYRKDAAEAGWKRLLAWFKKHGVA